MEKKWIAISVILAIICACVVMSVPVIKVAYTVKEPYTATETYYVKEPYTTTETYYVTEPYTDHVPLSYRTSGWYYYNHLWSDEFDLKITVKNTDDVGGRFWVTFHAVGTEGTYDSTTNSVFLMPGESHEFKHTFSGTHLSGCDYEIRRTTKEVTKYHDVSKERTVTKYHNVAKQRTVTKYRDVTKYKYISAFEYLMQGET